MAFVRSRVQRSSSGGFDRVGLGTGDDRVHVVGGLAHRRARSSPNFFSRCHYLSDCSLDDGVYDDTLAGACRRFVSLSHRGSTRYAGADRSGAAIFDYATTLDLLLDDLHGDERWLSDRWQHFRLRAPFVRRIWLFKFSWIAHYDLSHAFPREPRLRGAAFPDDLFSAQRSRGDR